VRDAKILGFIAKVAANLYRDNQLNLEGVDKRMKRLIDEYVSAQGIDRESRPWKLPTLASVSTSAERDCSGKASEMKHALRHFIRLRFDDDPSHYKKLSERLEEILRSSKTTGRSWSEPSSNSSSRSWNVRRGRPSRVLIPVCMRLFLELSRGH